MELEQETFTIEYELDDIDITVVNMDNEDGVCRVSCRYHTGVLHVNFDLTIDTKTDYLGRSDEDICYHMVKGRFPDDVVEPFDPSTLPVEQRKIHEMMMRSISALPRYKEYPRWKLKKYTDGEPYIVYETGRWHQDQVEYPCEFVATVILEVKRHISEEH